MEQQQHNDSPNEMSQSQTNNNNEKTVPAPEAHNNAAKRKKVLIILSVVIGLLAAVCIAYLLTQQNNSDDIELQPVTNTEVVTTLGASIASVEGSVQYSSDGESWKDASGGESLAHLDYVRTLDDSRAIVLFDDGSVIRLDDQTEVYLSSLEADAPEVTLQSGKVYSRVVESENTTYTVVTANERFVALGTAFTTSTDTEKDELEVYESKVEVESQDVVVSEGNKYDSDSKEASALDIDSLKDDEFTQWNKQKDSEIDEFKDKLGVLADKEESQEDAQGSEPTQTQETGITLSGVKSTKGVTLSWSVSGALSAEGYKVVRDKLVSTPKYGTHQAQYVGGSQSRSTVWYDDNGGTYYYRVCAYSAGSCTNYSNSVRVESPLVEKEPVKSGTISLTISGSDIAWTLGGGSAPHGFKVLVSSGQNPVYPQHSIAYAGSEASSITLPEKSDGTYYVRVCKYTNGTQEAGCVDYSNQVEYIVD